MAAPPDGSELPGSITAQIVPLFLVVAAEHGLEPAEVLARFAIPPEALSHPEARLPVDLVVRIWRELPEWCGADDFGLRVGTAVGSVDFLPRAVVTASPTVGVALRRYLRIERLLNDVPGVPPAELVVVDGVVSLRHHYVGLPRHLNESLPAGWAQLVRQAAGSVRFRRLEFEHPRPVSIERHREIFGDAELVFDAAANRFSFDAEILDRPNATYSRVIEPMVERYLDEATAMLPDRAPRLVRELRSTISRALPDGAPPLENVARAMRLSPRSLQRRLSEHGTSYTAVLDEVRRELALRFIADPARSLLDVALATGFSDQPAFQRAFVRWTGEPPGRYRRRR